MRSTAPVALGTYTVHQGTSFKPIATIVDEDGVPYDLSDSSITVICRLIRQASADDVITRTKGVAGETVYPTDGTDGQIQFIYAPDFTVEATLPAGEYRGEVVFKDTDPTPDDVVLAAWFILKVKAPYTAPI